VGDLCEKLNPALYLKTLSAQDAAVNDVLNYSTTITKGNGDSVIISKVCNIDMPLKAVLNDNIITSWTQSKTLDSTADYKTYITISAFKGSVSPAGIVISYTYQYVYSGPPSPTVTQRNYTGLWN
jgi:hypothetical protein